MRELSYKHWIAFGIIVFCNIAMLIIVPIIAGVAGDIVNVFPLINALLCLILIHSYLHESLREYGVHFRKIHFQVISGILLALIISFLIYGNTFSAKLGSWVVRLAKRRLNLYYISLLMANVVSEEIIYRGFILLFFQKIFKNPFNSIFFAAFLFGASHYPISHNFSQMGYGFVCGIVYGYLKIREPEKFTLFTLCLAHFLQNILADLFMAASMYI